jgi:sugar phosphate permease
MEEDDDNRYLSGPWWHWALIFSAIIAFVFAPFLAVHVMATTPQVLPKFENVRGNGGRIIETKVN